MEHRFFTSATTFGRHRIAYKDRGPIDAPIVICVHGLTRQSGDFDDLAIALSNRYRVICPDMAGRGASDRLANPADYNYPLYAADMTALILQLGTTSVDWIGTSMGGLIGMMMAANPMSPIRRMVLNDIGPALPKEALARIAAYVGNEPEFKSRAEADTHLRHIHGSFGPLSETQWTKLIDDSIVATKDGGFRLHYDPQIALNVRLAGDADIALWDMWAMVQCPVLVLRGVNSDLLSAATAAEMTARGRDGRGPPTEVVEIAKTGHAPALVDPAQIALIRDWLAKP